MGWVQVNPSHCKLNFLYITNDNGINFHSTLFVSLLLLFTSPFSCAYMQITLPKTASRKAHKKPQLVP